MFTGLWGEVTPEMVSDIAGAPSPTTPYSEGRFGFPEPIAQYRALPSPKRFLRGHVGRTQEFSRPVAAKRIDPRAQFAAVVSEVRLEGYVVRRQAANRAELLALPGMRRGLESEPARGAAARLVAAMMSMPPVSARDLRTTLVQLVELIAAIDKRLPQVQRTGESVIANAAMRLRIEASKRISEIELELAGRESLDSQPPSAF